MYSILILIMFILTSCFHQYEGNLAGKVSLNTTQDTIYSILQNYANLSGLPINQVFTDEEINNNLHDYSIGQNNEDAYLNGTQIIQKYGYKVEEHQVITSDGYILPLIRIPGKGKVVFLMHGLFCSYEDWLTAGVDRSLAFALATLDFDVWMGNARGNSFSKKHINLSSSDPKFWDFSWDEIGRLDLPAMIDYTLEETGADSLSYVAHSQGTTVFFVLCSEKPEYNDKFDLMVALSPIAWTSHLISPLVRIGSLTYNPVVYELIKSLGFNEFVPNEDLKTALTLTLCGNNVLATVICQNFIYILGGFDYPQLNYKQAAVIGNHFPSDSSLKQFEHYEQLVNSGFFRKFDYGTSNLMKYGSLTPPSYLVENIGVPIALFYSYGDWLSSPIDVEILYGKLRNVVDYYELPLKSFCHGDYLWAKDVKTLVYDRVINLINKYAN